MDTDEHVKDDYIQGFYEKNVRLPIHFEFREKSYSQLIHATQLSL